MKETRTLKMHPALLYSVIKSQAGTLSKAILELIMNSVDAGASRVDIELTRTSVSVADDGRGFSDRNAIEEFFETFGTPHAEGDAVYGKFRMGRGQIFAFARNRWRSGDFEMLVDVEGRGLDYELAVQPVPYAGCEISGELYQELSLTEQIRVSDEVAELCCYVSIPVILNGKDITKKLADQKWTAEDEDAYYLIRPNQRSLAVYNLGVLVAHYYNLGVAGTVVSKKQLEVNFARNDVMQAKCPVWKNIAKVLKQHVSDEARKPAQTREWRGWQIHNLLTANCGNTLGELYDMVAKHKLFTDFGSQHLSLLSVVQKAEVMGVTLPEDSTSLVADRIHQQRTALVLHPSMSGQFRGLSLSGVLQRIGKTLTELLPQYAAQDWQARNQLEEMAKLRDALHKADALVKPLAVLAANIQETWELVPDSKLSKQESILLSAIRIGLNPYVAYAIEQAPRQILVMTSDVADGFTDGNSRIWIHRKYLTSNQTKTGLVTHFTAVALLLLHEMQHTTDSSTGHGHPAEFYSEFHDRMHQRVGLWFSGVTRATARYAAACKKKGIALKLGTMSSVDLLDQVEAPIDLELLAARITD